MALVSFTLSEDGVAAFNEALVCIHKFSDDVSLEVKKDKLVLTALNLTKSAYASFTFAADAFFSGFQFVGNPQYRDRFYCLIYIKALLSVFRNRTGGEFLRDRENVPSIERCDVSIQDGHGVKSRFIATVFSRNGITSTHRLHFEAKAPVHAKFDRNEATNHWTINSRTLHSLMEHFGRGVDLLDINTDGEGVVNFTCFTEKQVAVSNEAVLKKPLHTTISVEKEEFKDIVTAEKLHIIINFRDFRAILQHASWASSDFHAAYSRPGRPMKITYSRDTIVCDIVLMTVDEKYTMSQKKGHAKVAARVGGPGLNAAPATAGKAAETSGDESRQPAPGPPLREQQAKQDKTIPQASRRPAAPRLSQFDIRAPLVQPQSTLKSESLFLPQPDDDEMWGPVNLDEDDEEGENPRLEWDASTQPNPSTMRISDHQANNQGNLARQDSDAQSQSYVDPTQRVSEVRKYGLLGDW